MKNEDEKAYGKRDAYCDYPIFLSRNNENGFEGWKMKSTSLGEQIDTNYDGDEVTKSISTRKETHTDNGKESKEESVEDELGHSFLIISFYRAYLSRGL